MRPRKRQETGEQDLFRSRLDRIIDLTHALVKLSRAIDWQFLEAQFGSVYSDGPGCPPLPTRLMAGLALVKHMYDLSDEALCDRWIENPYFQFFCDGMDGPGASAALHRSTIKGISHVRHRNHWTRYREERVSGSRRRRRRRPCAQEADQTRPDPRFFR
jgi:Transposase domain (DUF772)